MWTLYVISAIRIHIQVENLLLTSHWFLQSRSWKGYTNIRPEVCRVTSFRRFRWLVPPFLFFVYRMLPKPNIYPEEDYIPTFHTTFFLLRCYSALPRVFWKHFINHTHLFTRVSFLERNFFLFLPSSPEHFIFSYTSLQTFFSVKVFYV